MELLTHMGTSRDEELQHSMFPFFSPERVYTETGVYTQSHTDFCLYFCPLCLPLSGYLHVSVCAYMCVCVRICGKRPVGVVIWQRALGWRVEYSFYYLCGFEKAVLGISAIIFSSPNGNNPFSWATF